jgi:iron complex outermembrane receptor protein
VTCAPSLSRSPRTSRARGRALRIAVSASLALFACLAPPARADEPAPTPGANAPAPPPPAPPTRSVGEATITATRTKRGALEVPGNVTVIDRETIERSGVRDLPELLRREAGISVTNTTTNPEGYTVEGRGFQNGSGGGSSLLVLMDGRRMNEPSGSTTDWALVHLDDVERVEIVRGPASALYGDNAVGGVIQIVTRRPEGPPRASVVGRTGTFDADGGAFSVSGSEGPLGIALFGDAENQQGYRDRSEFRTRALAGRARLALGERLTLGVDGGYSGDDRTRPGSLDRTQIAELGRRAADPSVDRNFANTHVRRIAGSLEWLPLDDVRLRIEPFHRRRTDDTASGDPSFTFAAESESDVYGVSGQIDVDRALGPLANRLSLGSDLSREDADADSVLDFGGFASGTTSRSRRNVYGFFLQDELSVTEDLLVTAGVRYDHARYRIRQEQDPMGAGPTGTFRQSPSVWSPRAAVTYRILEPLSAYVSYARGFRFPSLEETAGYFSSQPALLPQKSSSYEGGVKWRSARLSAGLAVYTMDVEDEILLDPDVVQDFGFGPIVGVQNVNMDRVRHRGVELALDARPCDLVEVYGSYTLDDARVRRDSITGFDTEQVPITPLHRGTVGVVLHLPAYLELGANANYVGTRKLGNDFEARFGELAKYATYDATLGFRPRFGEHLEGFALFAVRNLFDREYSDFGARSSFVNDFGPTRVGFFPAPGRHYEVSIGLTVRR